MSASPGALRVLGSGVFALVLTLGVARFAYTPMLAYMQAQTGLDDALAGWLAGWNYAGYLCGVLLVSRLRDMVLKDRLYRLGLLLAVATTAMMALGDSALLWGLSRFLAGLSAAAGLILGSGLILSWLLRQGQRGELGLHFSGMGLGIVLSALLVECAAPLLDWRGQWWLLSALGLLLLWPAWRWLPRPDAAAALPADAPAEPGEPPAAWLWLLQLAYLCAGFGYVVYATFTVLITEQQPALGGQGGVMWLLAGLAATPAPVLWDRLARRLGDLPSLQLAFVLQTLSVALPVLSGSLPAAVLSALLYGLTTVGIVSLVLTMVGRRYPAQPARVMARLTIGFGLAQILGPVIAGELAERAGRFDAPLLLVAATLLIGLACLEVMRRLPRP